MKKIGLIDVDGHNFPSIPLMKISAWHKKQGDHVEWYEPMFSGHMDKVYMSKVFSFTPDYEYFVDADKVIKGGSGYCIKIENGKELYDKTKDKPLPKEIEHIYPDYSLYPEMTKDTAYGFLTRGCPRGCSFCHTGVKDGLRSIKVADLSEFWNGQKNICLLDQNILACKEWKNLLQQLIDSKATVEFNGGLDIRLMTEEKASYIRQIKIKQIHFAWDRYKDKNIVTDKLDKWTKIVGEKYNRTRVICYVLCGFDTTMEQNLERIYWLRSRKISSYVMLYDKEHIPKGHELRKLQRWVNNRFIFWSCDNFYEYLRK